MDALFGLGSLLLHLSPVLCLYLFTLDIPAMRFGFFFDLDWIENKLAVGGLGDPLLTDPSDPTVVHSCHNLVFERLLGGFWVLCSDCLAYDSLEFIDVLASLSAFRFGTSMVLA